MRKAYNIPLHVRLPPKTIRMKFLVICELNGAQEGVNFLTNYYGIRRMKIVLMEREWEKERATDG